MLRGQVTMEPPSVEIGSARIFFLQVTLLTGRVAPKYLLQTLRGLGILNIFPVTENLIPVGSVTGATSVGSKVRSGCQEGSHCSCGCLQTVG